MKTFWARLRRRQRLGRHQDFLQQLSQLRAEAHNLGLHHVHAHLARALSYAPFEMRAGKEMGNGQKMAAADVARG